MDFGTILKILIINRNIPIKDLANSCNVKEKDILSCIEGEKVLEPEVLRNLSIALGLEPTDLIVLADYYEVPNDLVNFISRAAKYVDIGKF